MAMDDPVFIGVLAALIVAFVVVGFRGKRRAASGAAENPFADDHDGHADR